MREIQRSEDFNYVENLLGSKNISDFLGQVESQLNFNNAIQKQVDIIQGEKKRLEVNKSSKEGNKLELVKLQTELSSKKKAVDYTKSEQNKILSETKNQEKNFQKLLKDRVALKNAVEKEVFDYEAKLKYKLNPSSIPQAGSSPLMWPIDNVIITQRFGKGPAAKKLYVSGSHNGVDFGARIGTPVKAVLSGTVIGTGDTDKACPRASFGRWVLIRHDNGLASIVAHLSVISATQGQVVKTGDIIGYSGNTGYSTGPHVHLTVYAADAVKVQDRPSASCAGKVFTMPIAPIEAYLDPMLYLPTN
jgi:murein DD-endopeptidase MepM/ murein hydrolase activator NlpD